MQDKWGELRSEVHKCVEGDCWSDALGRVLMSYSDVEFFDALMYVMGAIRNSTILTWGLRGFLARSAAKHTGITNPSEQLIEALNRVAGAPPDPVVLTARELHQIEQADLAARAYKWGNNE